MIVGRRTQLYIAAVTAGGILAGIAAAWRWPVDPGARPIWLFPTLLVLVAVAGRFPIKLSRQAEATLYTIPLFMAALLLHPLEAALLGAAGVLAAEVLLKSPLRATIFNVSVGGLLGGLAGIVFYSLRPEGAPISLAHGPIMAALAAGMVLQATNLVLVIGITTVQSGKFLVRPWQKAYLIEAVQEGGFLALGLIGAILVADAWWGLFLVIIPLVLAHYGLSRSVEDAARNALLVVELENRLAQVNKLQDQLVQSAKLASVGTLAAGVAHEISNPVFAITGRTEYLLKEADRYLTNQKTLEYVQVINEMGVRITSIVKQLLDYARPADEVEETRLEEAMEGALRLLGRKPKLKNIRVERDYDGLPVVMAVNSQLQQVFVNLISNALDASPESGVITVGCKTDDSTAVAYVKDLGAGMLPGVKDRIFEPFFTTKAVGEGTGLGLFISHRIVASHRGQIVVDSEQGVGTTVWVRMPLAESRTQDEIPAKAASQLRTPIGSGRLR